MFQLTILWLIHQVKLVPQDFTIWDLDQLEFQLHLNLQLMSEERMVNNNQKKVNLNKTKVVQAWIDKELEFKWVYKMMKKEKTIQLVVGNCHQ